MSCEQNGEAACGPAALRRSPAARRATLDRENPSKSTSLRQLVVTLAETFEAHGKANAFLWRLEDDEGCGLAAAQLLEQIVVHHDLRHAAVGQAAHEAGASDIGLVDLQPEA